MPLVIGERKLGKSSLLTALAQPATMERFGLDPGRTLFVYIDLEGMASPGERILGRVAGSPGCHPAARRFARPGEGCWAEGAAFHHGAPPAARVRDSGLDLVLAWTSSKGWPATQHYPDFYGELRSLAGEMGVVYLTVETRAVRPDLP